MIEAKKLDEAVALLADADAFALVVMQGTKRERVAVRTCWSGFKGDLGERGAALGVVTLLADVMSIKLEKAE